MTTLTLADQNMLLQAILTLSFIFAVFGFMVLHFLYTILDKFIFKRIRVPKKIKTKHGELFRTDSGIYVLENELDDFNDDYRFSNKQRAIRILEYRLERLKNQIKPNDLH